jgi:D-ribose pyranase
MLKTGILNPQILSLLARVRHTNTIVLADRGFPSWPGIETVDISLIDDVPQVAQLFAAIQEHWKVGHIWMAEEFFDKNSKAVKDRIADLAKPLSIQAEPHVQFKLRVPKAVGLIRTGDTTQYANMILESA